MVRRPALVFSSARPDFLHPSGSPPLTACLYAIVTRRDESAAARYQRAIGEYLTHYNQQPKPFIWTKDADTILTKIDRCLEPLNSRDW